MDAITVTTVRYYPIQYNVSAINAASFCYFIKAEKKTSQGTASAVSTVHCKLPKGGVLISGLLY